MLKKIFGKGFGSKEIELYKLVQQMTPTQKRRQNNILLVKVLYREVQHNTVDSLLCWRLSEYLWPLI